MPKFILEVNVDEGVTVEEVLNDLKKILYGKIKSSYTEDDITILVDDSEEDDDVSIEVDE